MGLLNWFRKRGAREKHFSSLAALLEGYRREAPIGTDYTSQAKEGFEKNHVAYRAIMDIAQAVAGIPYLVTIKGKEIEKGNPVYDLLRRPNPCQPYKELMKILTIHRLVNGNCYLLGIQAISFS